MVAAAVEGAPVVAAGMVRLAVIAVGSPHVVALQDGLRLVGDIHVIAGGGRHKSIGKTAPLGAVFVRGLFRKAQAFALTDTA